jgi:tetratricopeptide (TPR) repeat protein
MTEPNEKHNNNSLRSPLNIIALFLIAATFIIFFLGEKLVHINWGINQIGLLPSFLPYLWIFLVILFIIWIRDKPLNSVLPDRIGEFLWGRNSVRKKIIFIMTALAIFVIFRFEAHLYGNGYIRVANFAQKSKPIFRWFEYGSTLLPYIFYWLFHSLGAAKETAAVWGYQIVSFLSGAAFLFVVFRISEIITERNDRRWIFLGLTSFSGLSLFFFGMVENYPILLPLGGLYLYVSLLGHRHKDAKHLYWLWIILILGLFLNIQFICTLPAAIYTTIIILFKNSKRSGSVGFMVSALLAVTGVVILYLLAGSDIAIRNMILLLSGKSPDTDYGLFDTHHLADIINLLFLLAPLFMIFPAAIIAGFGNLKRDSFFITLGLMVLSQLTYLFILDPKNGMAREIDQYGFLLIGLIFWGGYSIIAEGRGRRLSESITRWLVPMAFLLIIPCWIVHLSPDKTATYLDQFLTYNESKYEQALLAFRDYNYMVGNFSEAENREQLIKSKAKGALESQLIDDLYYRGRTDESFAYAVQLVERYPYNAIYRMQLGNLLKHYKKYGEAEQQFDMAIALEPYRIELYHFKGDLCRSMGAESRSFEVWMQAESFAPRDAIILTDLMGYYYRSGVYDKVDSLANLVISIDTTGAYPYMFKGLLAEKAGQLKAALDFYSKYIGLNDGLPEVPQIRKRMNEITLRMADTTSNR